MPPLPCLALQEALAAQVAATAASAHAAALHAELSAAQQELEAARAAAEEQRATEQALRTELALLQQVWLGEGSSASSGNYTEIVAAESFALAPTRLTRVLLAGPGRADHLW